MTFHQGISFCRIYFVTVISSLPELGHVAIHGGEKEKVLRKRTNRFTSCQYVNIHWLAGHF